jgi:23S rRNA pseudouridine2604 synthase
VDDGKVRTGKPVDRSNNPYAPTPSNKKNQEPRRHGKLRDEDGRPIRVVAPRLAPLDAGIRLSKQLSDQGLCSRREADEFIEKGWVTVNGERATLGQRVLPTDRVQVAKQAERAIESRVTILINKPVGLVSGQAEDGYAPAVSLVTPENQWINDVAQISFEHKHLRGLAPAGRLDIDSVGLLVLTQDGRVAKALIGDKSDVDKEYLVRVEGELSAEGLKLLNHGLELDGVPLRKAKVTWQNEDQLRFVLTEGKKRQIRRMCELVGLNVVGLKRIRIGKVVLGDLPTGMWRYLSEDEAF